MKGHASMKQTTKTVCGIVLRSILLFISLVVLLFDSLSVAQAEEGCAGGVLSNHFEMTCTGDNPSNCVCAKEDVHTCYINGVLQWEYRYPDDCTDSEVDDCWAQCGC